jgi:hypothetical protein
MPIEILAEGAADWRTYSLKPDILFLGVDPFWKTKALNDPNLATLFRGGPQFLDVSHNGGYSWTSMLPSTSPPWYEDADYAWWSTVPPIPLPTGTGPTPSELTYHSYAGSEANTGEHAILATYTIVDGIATDIDLCTMWVLYTVDDWSTHAWTQIVSNMAFVLRAATEGTPLVANTLANVQASTVAARRITTTKIAVTYSTYSALTWTHYGQTIDRDVSTLTSAGIQSTADPNLSPSDPFVYGNGVYFAALHTYMDVGIMRGRIKVWGWDFSSAGAPTALAVDISADLPDFNQASFTGSIYPIYMTAGGLLVFLYYNQDGSGNSTDNREWYWLYYNTATGTFSTPFQFHVGVGTDTPWSIKATMQSIGGNKVVATLLEGISWTGRASGAHDWTGKTFIMNAGTWTQIDTDTFLSEATSTISYRMGKDSSKLLTNYRYIVYVSRVTASRPRVYNYVAGTDTLTPIAYGGSGGSDFGEYPSVDATGIISCIQDDPIGSYLYANGNNSDGNVLYWSDPTDFPHKAVEYSTPSFDDMQCSVTNNFTKYIRGYYDGGTNEVTLSVVTIAAKEPDMIFGRRFIGDIAFTPDGNYIYIPTATMEYTVTPTPPLDWETVVDRLTRHPDGAVGVFGYPTGMSGFYFFSFDSGYDESDIGVNTFTSCAPWEAQSAGVVMFGLLYGVSIPATPLQIYGYFNSGLKFIWGALDLIDTVKAIISINNKLYALVETSTGVELWKEKAVTAWAGDDMEYVSDTGLDSVDHGVIDVDGRDDSIVTAHGEADLLMVLLSEPPYSTWQNYTWSHRNDRGVTGIIVLD